MNGKRITRLRDLELAAARRRAVVVPCNRKYRRPCPASYLMNMTGVVLAVLLEQGMFLWDVEPRRKAPWEEKPTSPLDTGAG